MGQKSTKDNKNIYFTSREAAGLTREAAAEAMDYISRSRIEKIEYEKSLPHPEEVLEMAKYYKAPALCNYFCSHECPIGRQYVPEVKEKALSQITLEMLATLNELTMNRDRLIRITADGEITAEELPDFMSIKKDLEKMSQVIESLNLWLDKEMAEGKLGVSVISAYD